MRIPPLAIATAIAVLGASAGSSAQLSDPTHETTTAPVPGMTPSTSLCRISTDETYGLTPANPVKTGGGDMYMASRQVKFMSALRGPAGEGTHFKRGGSNKGPDGTILDIYSMEILGGKKVTIYIDGYHWVEPIAPAGFLCGVAMNLAPPGPDSFETMKQQRGIAIQLGEAEVEPISLDPDGSKKHGIAYDYMRLIGVAARAAKAAGKTLDVNALPREVVQARMVVIATPLACGAETIAPETITVADARGSSPPSTGKAGGDQIAGLVPGLPPMPGAVAVVYSVPNLIAGARTTIHYTKPCEGVQDVTLPVNITQPRVLREAPAPPPAGKAPPADGGRVVMQLFVAADGSALFPAFVSGAFEFTDAAIESLKGWRFEPSRVNGAQLYQPEKVMVVVK
jgi:hypothetical protein